MQKKLFLQKSKGSLLPQHSEVSPLSVALLLAVLPSSCRCYFYIIDVNNPILIKSLLPPIWDYSLEEVLECNSKLNLIYKGKFHLILKVQDKAVYFFCFEKSEMKRASSARNPDFSLPFVRNDGLFCETSNTSFDISLDVTVVAWTPSQFDSITRESSEKLQNALSTGDSNLEEIKTLAKETIESMKKLKSRKCDVKIPELLITSCLENQLKQILEPHSFIVSRVSGNNEYLRAASLKEDLRIYHETKFLQRGELRATSITVSDPDSDSDVVDSDSDTDIVVGCAIELKPAGDIFIQTQPQLLRNMECVASDLAYMAVKEGKVFDKIVIYGGIIVASDSKVQPSVLMMDFVKNESSFTYGKHLLTVNDFFSHIVYCLQADC